MRAVLLMSGGCRINNQDSLFIDRLKILELKTNKNLCWMGHKLYLERIVHPKMKKSSFIYPHDVPNPYDFLSGP